MKLPIFDIVVIIISAIILVMLSEFDLLETISTYMLPVLLAFYFLGQYSVKRVRPRD